MSTPPRGRRVGRLGLAALCVLATTLGLVAAAPAPTASAAGLNCDPEQYAYAGYVREASPPFALTGVSARLTVRNAPQCSIGSGYYFSSAWTMITDRDRNRYAQSGYVQRPGAGRYHFGEYGHASANTWNTWIDLASSPADGQQFDYASVTNGSIMLAQVNGRTLIAVNYSNWPLPLKDQYNGEVNTLSNDMAGRPGALAAFDPMAVRNSAGTWIDTPPGLLQSLPTGPRYRVSTDGSGKRFWIWTATP